MRSILTIAVSTFFKRIAWFVLVFLAAFVIFVECVAHVGGDSDPIPQPTPTEQAVE